MQNFRQRLTQIHLFVLGKTSLCNLENVWQNGWRDKLGFAVWVRDGNKLVDSGGGVSEMWINFRVLYG